MRKAVRGALAQTYSPLEIIISDDCSTDRTFAIIRESISRYNGPHKIIVNRNETNMGLSAHANWVFSLANGELIVGAAGDDISLPHRTETIHQTYIRSDKRAHSFCSNMLIVDAKGRECGIYKIKGTCRDVIPLKQFVANNGGIYGSAHACTQHIFNFFGPLPEKVWHDDMVLGFRAGLIGDIQIIQEPLVLYRRHEANLSKPMGDLRSLKRLMQERKSRALDLKLVFEAWLADIAVVKSRQPHRSSELQELQDMILPKKERMATEIQMFDAGFCERIRLIQAALKQKTNYATIRRWIAMFFTPRLYLAHLKLKKQWLLRYGVNKKIIR